MLNEMHMEEIIKLKKLLDSYRLSNEETNEYYTGKNRLKSLNISLPEDATNLKAGIAYPATVVEAIEERIQLEGFSSEKYDVDDIYFENNLASESSMVHIDALEYGCAYIIVGKGGPGEPSVLITPESPNNVVGIRNLRTRKLDRALDLKYTGVKKEAIGTLYLLNETVPFYIDEEGGYWDDGEIDEHNNGMLPVFQIINRPQTSNMRGRSEITETVKSNTDAAVRTMVDMEITREHFGRPKPVFGNVSMAEFEYEDGSPRNPINVRANEAIVLGKGDNSDPAGGGGSGPTVTQLQAGNPTMFLPMLEEYATQVANHSGIPLHRFLNSPVNAPSADALRALEAPLIAKAERRITNFGRVWEEVMRYAIFIRDGVMPESRSISAIFRKPETPTIAATADAAVKLVQSGIYTADSELTLSALNLSVREQEIWKNEKGQAAAIDVITKLAQAKGALPAAGPQDVVRA